MRAHLTNSISHRKIFFTLVMVLMMTMTFSACQNKTNNKTVRCNSDACSLYHKAIEEGLPAFTIEQSDHNPYYNLEEGALVEAFDTQAIGALETGLARNWYPHYLATVIIALDRNQTDAEISGWNDLYTAGEEVAFLNTPGNTQMLIAAMSYGLEGEDYTLTKAIKLMASLREEGLLKMNSTDSPITICYDYQASDLIEGGRKIEMIIPQEGTFTYEKGLLSNQRLEFADHLDEILLESKLRLLDGRSESYAYPKEISYRPATRISDYKHFAKTTQNADRLIERNVMKSRFFMSIDSFEHLMVALIYIIIITIWTTLIIRRSMQKGVSHAAFYTGIILIGWIFVRLIRYQLELSPTLSRYLWYSYYLFQLTLPLVLLWMAWAIDKPRNDIIPPKWWKSIAVLVSILVVLVFTNDLHGFVLDLDLSRQDWGENYGYSFAYYIMLFVCMVNLLAVFIILIKKSLRNPRKKLMILPIIVFILFGFYNYKYIMRDPFVYATDLTIITGLFAMLMFESCMRSGMIPVNTKYIELFQRSPLKIQIIDEEGGLILESEDVRPLDENMIGRILAKSPGSIIQDDDTLLFASPIPGGHAVWHEDIDKIVRLNSEIEQSTKMLSEANAILMKEKKLKQSAEEAQVKKELMKQLENQIAKSIDQLTKMIEQVPYSLEQSKDATRIALLLCYIKRRCNLFFQEKEENDTRVEKLVFWLDELADIAEYSNVQMARVNETRGKIYIRQATLFYDVFYQILDLAIKRDSSYIVGYLEIYDERLEMRLLLSQNIGKFELDDELLKAILAIEGKIDIKDLDDTKGVTMSFLKGGEAYD